VKKLAKNTKTLLIILGGLAALVLTGWGLWLHLWAPEWLAKKLSQNYSNQISFQKVTPGWLTSLAIQNISVRSPFAGEIKTLHLSIQPWALFSIKPQNRKLFWLKIEQAKFLVPLDSPSPSTQGNPIIDLTPLPISFGCRIKKSEIDFKKGSEIYPVTSIDGIFSSSNFGIDSNIKAKVFGGEPVLSRFRLRTKGAKDWTGNWELRNFPAKSIYSILKWDENNRGYLGGKFQADLSFQGKGPFHSLKDVNWNLTLSSKDLNWQKTPEGTPLKIDASISATNEGVSINRIRIDDNIDLEGKITDLWTEPKYALVCRAQNWKLDNLRKLTNPKSPLENLSGTSNFELTLSGLLKDPKIEGTYQLDALYGPAKLPPLIGTVAYEDEMLKADAQFSGGRIKIRTEKNPEFGRELLVLMDGLSLETLGQCNGWSNIQGKFASKLRLHLSPSMEPELGGVFDLADLTWGRNRKNEVVKGRITLKPDRIQIDTVDKSLVVNASFTESRIEVESLKVVFGEGSAITARGNSDLAQGKFNYSINGTKIRPDIWPPLVARYPDINGSMDFSGKIFGIKYEPELNVSLLINNVQLLPEGGTWNGTMDLAWTQKTLNLKNVQLDGGYRGEVSLENNEGKWSGEANLSLDKSNPRLFTDFFKSTFPAKGFISGFAQVKFKGSSLTGVSSATWSEGEIGPANFDQAHFEARMRGNKITVENFKILKGPRALVGSGNFDLDDPLLKFNSDFHLHQVGNSKLTCDGEIHAAGEFNFKEKTGRADIRGPNLWINDFSFYDCRLLMEKNRDKWSGEINLGNKIKGNVQILSSSQQMKGLLSVEGFKLEEIAPQIFPKDTLDDWPKGNFSAKADIFGSLSDPKIKFFVKAPITKWRKETFSAQLIAEADSSTVTIKALKTAFPNGATVYSTGFVRLDEEGFMHLEGAGTNLEIQTIFHFIDWPVKWEGKTDSTFVVEGPSGSRTVKFTFAGRHKGFEPFDGDGNVTGTVKWKNHEWDVSGIRIDCGGGYVKILEGSKVFRDLTKSGTMRLLVETRNIKSGILTLFGQFEVVGKWLPGPENPVELDIFARPLWLNQFALEGNVTHMTVTREKINFSPIYGSDQQLSGIVEYPDFPAINVKRFTLTENGVEKFFLDGAIGKYHWDYKLRAKNTEADTVMGLIDLPVDVKGLMDIEAIGLGSSPDPIIEAKFIWKDGAFGIVPLDSARFKFSLKNGIAEITDLSANSKKGYQLTGKARFGTDFLPENVSLPPTINLKITKGNLAILESMWNDCKKAKGSFEGELNFGEEKGEFLANGFFEANDAYLKTNSYIPLLKNGRFKLKVEENKIKIEEARAQIGNGELAIGGKVSLDDKDPKMFDLSLKTVSPRGISIQVPELTVPPGPVLGHLHIFQKELAGVSKGEVKINANLSGPAELPILKGDVEIENALFTYPEVKTKKGENQSKTPFSRWFQNIFRNVGWDLTLQAGKKTRYENDLVFASIEGSLLFQGPSSDLYINGRITSQQGSIVYAGNEFKINNAVLEIITETPKITKGEKSQTFVYLTATAERDVSYLDVSGNSVSDTIIMDVDRAQFGEIQPRFRSKNNPELPSQKAVLLALGIPPTSSLGDQAIIPNPTGNQKTNQDVDLFLRASLVQLLDSSFTSPLARTIARRTGLVDTIRVTYQAPEISPDNPAATSPQGPSQGATSANPAANQWWRTLRGTKVKLGKEVVRGLYADYSFKFDEYQNQLDFKHELELAYQLHQNLFLRATSELDSQRTLGRDPERKAMLEKWWRFGLPKKSKPKESPPPEPASSPKFEPEPKPTENKE